MEESRYRPANRTTGFTNVRHSIPKPINRRAAFAASQAVPFVRARRNRERWILVLVEGAQAHHVLAHPPQLDAARFRQPLH
jgi:hypothetical protein